MLEFLRTQRKRLKLATSQREFRRLVEETESRLLGETAEWFSRRAVTGVS